MHILFHFIIISDELLHDQNIPKNKSVDSRQLCFELLFNFRIFLKIDNARIMRIIIKEVLLKYRELVKKLNELGWEIVRQGGNHEIFSNGESFLPIPRHKEINELLAKSIIKRATDFNKKEEDEL